MPATQNSPEHVAMLRLGLHRSWERRRNGEGYLYTAEMVGTDVVKIGHSLNPEVRVRDIRLSNGVKAKLLAMIQAPVEDERALHQTLRGHCRIDLPGFEFYPRTVLSHPALPDGLRVEAPAFPMWAA